MNQELLQHTGARRRSRHRRKHKRRNPRMEKLLGNLAWLLGGTAVGLPILGAAIYLASRY